MEILRDELKTLETYIFEDFYDPISTKNLNDFLNGKSKRIRFILNVLCLKSLGINLSDEVYKILSATEIIHNASLLHDDVLDNAESRRNKPSFWIQNGSKISILAGDYLVSFAIKKLISLNNNEFLNIFQECIKDMCIAEINQYELRGKIPAKEKYLEICKNKTAKLFSAPARCIQIKHKIEAFDISNFAEKFGLYFQLKNDTEKLSANTDKKNGIYTIKDILGIENAKILLDNFLEELLSKTKTLPENIYKEELERIIKEL